MNHLTINLFFLSSNNTPRCWFCFSHPPPPLKHTHTHAQAWWVCMLWKNAEDGSTTCYWSLIHLNHTLDVFVNIFDWSIRSALQRRSSSDTPMFMTECAPCNWSVQHHNQPERILCCFKYGFYYPSPNHSKLLHLDCAQIWLTMLMVKHKPFKPHSMSDKLSYQRKDGHSESIIRYTARHIERKDMIAEYVCYVCRSLSILLWQ